MLVAQPFKNPLRRMPLLSDAGLDGASGRVGRPQAELIVFASPQLDFQQISRRKRIVADWADFFDRDAEKRLGS
jgi:hypothetical protein